MHIESFIRAPFDACAPFDAPPEVNSWLCDASANTTNQLSLLKRLWGNKVSDPMYAASKFLGMVKKDTTFGGEGRYVNVRVSPIAGVSATFADALASQEASVPIRFFVTHRTQYAVFSIQNSVIERTRGNANAVLEALGNEAKAANLAFSRQMARRVHGNGGGMIGQLSASATLASTTLLVRGLDQIAGIEKNMQLIFASADGSAASASSADIRSSGGVPVYLRVTAVDRDAGTATMSALLNTVPGITVNDFFGLRGDYAQAMTGWRGWTPPSTPTGGDSFMGYNRSLDDVQRTAGIRVFGGGKPKLDVLEDAAAEAKINNVEFKTLLMNPRDFRDIKKEMSTQIQYTDIKMSNGTSFKAVTWTTQAGDVAILSETDVPQGFAWGGDPDQMFLRTTAEVPKEIHYPGNQLLIAADDDARQGRLGAYGNIFNEDPGRAMAISWNATS